MPNRSVKAFTALVMVAACASMSPVAADDLELPLGNARTPAMRSNPLGVNPLDHSALDRKRGGMEVLNEMRLRGVVADNEAVNLITGSNTINGGAFAGSAGLPMVIQNSGNNVLIQNATIVNVQVK